MQTYTVQIISPANKIQTLRKKARLYSIQKNYILQEPTVAHSNGQAV
jgi:hypothetical protein